MIFIDSARNSVISSTRRSLSKVQSIHFLLFTSSFTLFYISVFHFNAAFNSGSNFFSRTPQTDANFSAFLHSTAIHNLSTSKLRNDHLFITTPIYYEDPKSFHRPTIAVVAAADKAFSPRSLLCTAYRNGHKRVTLGSIQKITFTPYCKWATYLVLCPVQSKIETFGISTTHSEEPLTLNFIRADSLRRSVVVCMSRMFLYENWQILLTTLEIYRYYGVDLLVAYIDSIVAGAYELLQVYAKEGLVMIEPSVKIYHNEDMAFNPNDESEWGNQMIVYNHCLYRFRESAEFVVFADWDDVLVPRGSDGGMVDSLRTLFDANSRAGAFQLHRMSTTVFAAADPKHFDLTTTLTTMHVSEFFGPGKVVAIPSRIKGAWVHKPSVYEYGYQLAYARTHQSWFYHLRILSTYKEKPPKDAKIRPNELNSSEIVKSFNEFYKSKNIDQIFTKLPTSQTYLIEMEKCYKEIAHIFNLNSHGHCPNQAFCPVPQLPIDCINVSHEFAERRMANTMLVSYRTKSEFLFSRTGCLP
ncbi:hypothetical protein QR680_002317 [Steinernema hermaphroditum]|uniref:Glycosyltransferase family 92 protein n=1 Tax=Steinernema hermaphroditum TaxID=289476 RepID=A0AA39LI33_9BILA|nr:hypothetical protein QR680_002317 [Steinernema hermaphroditum]